MSYATELAEKRLVRAKERCEIGFLVGAVEHGGLQRPAAVALSLLTWPGQDLLVSEVPCTTSHYRSDG